jgi:uncharacterized protein YjbJ (UPF0337 family)
MLAGFPGPAENAPTPNKMGGNNIRPRRLFVSTRDKASNKAQDLKGKVKETVGSATGNEDLRTKGKTDQTKAALKDVGEKVKDAGSNLKDAIKGD